MLLADLAEYKSFVNPSGIAFAILGTSLVWRCLTEINFSDNEACLRGKETPTVPDLSSEGVCRLRCPILFSKFCLFMILAGRGPQIEGDHIPYRDGSLGSSESSHFSLSGTRQSMIRGIRFRRLRCRTGGR